VLSGLYAGARCVAYVPLLEGWGLPVVEAMATGTPVVASPVPSAGGRALEVDPEDEGAITEGLVAACCDEPLRARLVSAGLERASQLTWAQCARRHVAVWQDAA
jgi:alpha-1,3-rhamnosyl/mannosyltransferase